MLPKAFSCFTLSCAGTGNTAKSMYTLCQEGSFLQHTGGRNITLALQSSY